MKILLLDPQRKVCHRISKDTSGGYGTGNDFGDTLIPNTLKYLIKKIVIGHQCMQSMLILVLQSIEE